MGRPRLLLLRGTLRSLGRFQAKASMEDWNAQESATKMEGNDDIAVSSFEG